MQPSRGSTPSTSQTMVILCPSTYSCFDSERQRLFSGLVFQLSVRMYTAGQAQDQLHTPCICRLLVTRRNSFEQANFPHVVLKKSALHDLLKDLIEDFWQI